MKKNIYDKKNDNELVTEYRLHADNDAINELISRYSSKIYSLCTKYLNERDSEDAVLEILGKLINILRKHTICNFKSWIYVVTKNHCLMKKRQTERECLQFYDPVKFEHLSMEISEDDNHTYIDLISPEDIKEAINQLKESQRVCIHYFYYAKKSYKEISDLTGFNLKQVKSYIQNGKRNLKNYFILNKKVQNG